MNTTRKNIAPAFTKPDHATRTTIMSRRLLPNIMAGAVIAATSLSVLAPEPAFAESTIGAAVAAQSAGDQTPANGQTPPVQTPPASQTPPPVQTPPANQTPAADPKPAGGSAAPTTQPGTPNPDPANPAPQLPADPGKIAIVGDVQQPGAFIYKPILVKDALAAVGGLKKSADRCRITVYRNGLGLGDLKKARGIRYDLTKVEKGKAEDIALLPGDVVEVPVHRDRSILGQISGAFNHVTGQVASLAGAVAQPLIAANPALGALLNTLKPAQKPSNTYDTAAILKPAAQGATTSLEDALAKALAGETPEVRARVLESLKALQTGK